jgi:hypothetical protein
MDEVEEDLDGQAMDHFEIYHHGKDQGGYTDRVVVGI